MSSFINLLAKELENKLPGKKAQDKMSPDIRKRLNHAPDNKTKNSCVLIAIYSQNNEYFTILFKRPDYDGIHAGQVCFPGGKVESGDTSFEDTALREAAEEIGLNKKIVKIIGKLTPLYIPVSNYIVQPFIAYIESIPILVPDSKEVDRILIAPLKSLLNPENVMSKKINFRGSKMVIPYFFINSMEIWGATAMILSEFLTILKRPSFQHTDLYSADNVL